MQKKTVATKLAAAIMLAALAIVAFALLNTAPAVAGATAGSGSYGSTFIMPGNGYVTVLSANVDAATSSSIDVYLRSSDGTVLTSGNVITGSGTSGWYNIYVSPVFVYSGSSYSITVNVNDAFYGYTVNDVELTYTPYYLINVVSAYGSPTASAYVVEGGNYTASVTSPINGTEYSGARYQYTCDGYSLDGGSLVADTSITLTNILADHTVSFSWTTTTQYYLTISTSHGTATSEGWYDEGSTAYASLNTGTVAGGTGIQYSFASWSAGGTNYASSSPITMNYPTTVSASWTTQYLLTVSSAYGLPTSGTGYYNSGATAYAGVSSSVDGSHTLVGWSGDASGTGTTSNAITMTAPKTATAVWTSSSTPSGPTSYNVTISGPYLENGSPADGYTTHFYLSFTNGSVYDTYLTSNLTDAGSIYIESTTPFVQLNWNASSTSATLNGTRLYRFANGANSINDSYVRLFILDPDKPAYQYTFSISDYYGMVDPYLQTSITPDGTNYYVVERVNLAEGGGYYTFVMQQYQMYTLTFICQQGTYSQTFTANTLGTPGQYPVNLNVLSGNFPSTTNATIVTAYANRTDNTIYVSYVDPTLNTTWVNMTITHIQGDTTVTDYTSPTAASNSEAWTWGLADPTVTYTVTVTSLSGDTPCTFKFALAPDNGANPWDIDWSFLGVYIPTLPVSYTGWGGIDPTQIIAALLIMFALGIGSYYSTGASCIISWVIAGILLSMGWWQGSVPLFIFAGVVSILILIDEYKKGNFNL